MLDVADAIVRSALQRAESRGAHQRTDFPKRDDKNYLAHSLVKRGDDGVMRVEYVPVTITRWPPGERIYGEPAPKAAAGEPIMDATITLEVARYSPWRRAAPPFDTFHGPLRRE